MINATTPAPSGETGALQPRHAQPHELGALHTQTATAAYTYVNRIWRTGQACSVRVAT